jgi:hypothetical protein
LTRSSKKETAVPVNHKIEVVGVKNALRDLGKFDKDLARDLRKDARRAMKPIVDDAKRNIPTTALSGMSRPWTSARSGVQLLPWDGTQARKYVKAKTSTKKPREFQGVTRDLAAFYVSWAGGVNAIFDMAGRRSNSVMAANLTGKFGPPSRIMWPAAERHEAQVSAEISKVVDDVVRATNDKLGRRIR